MTQPAIIQEFLVEAWNIVQEAGFGEGEHHEPDPLAIAAFTVVAEHFLAEERAAELLNLEGDG